MTGNFKGQSTFDGNNNVSNGQNVLNFAGDSAWNTGLNNISGTANNTITLTDNAQMHVANKVVNGINVIAMSGASKWDKASNVSGGGNNTITMTGTSTWDGISTVTGGTNAIIMSGAAGNTWTGNSIVSGANTVNTITLNGTGSKWKGDSTLASGTNSVTVAGSSAMEGNNIINGGNNYINVADTGKITGDTKVNNAGQNTITMTGGNIDGNIDVNNAGQNTITMSGEALISGGNITVNDTASANTMSVSGNAIIENNLINKGGTMAGTFAGNSQLGNNGTSTAANNTINAGTTELSFGGQSTWLGNNTVTGTGTNKITLNGTTGNAWKGDSIIDSIGAKNEIVLAGAGAWTGDNGVSAGANTITAGDSSSWTGNSTVTGNDPNVSNTINLQDNTTWQGNSLMNTDNNLGSNNINASGSAAWNGKNSVYSGITTGNFSGNATFTGDNIVAPNNATDTAGIKMNFSGDSKFVGNNILNGQDKSLHTISIEGTDHFQWTGDATQNGGNMIVNLAGASNWQGNSAVTAGEAEITLQSTAKWQGDMALTGTGAAVLLGKGAAEFMGNVTVNSNAGANSAYYGYFTDNAKLTGSLTTEGGSGTYLELDTNASWNNGTNTVNDGEVTIIAGGNAQLNAVNNVVNAGTNHLSLADDTAWTGNNTVTGGTNSIGLTDAAKWQGSSNDTGSGTSAVSLSNNAIWFMHGNSTVNGLTMQDSSKVDMAGNIKGGVNLRNYETLTINDLDGEGGSFVFDTDLDKAVYGSETTDGDKLVVNGSSTGTHYVQVSDASLYTGTEIDGERKLLMITDLSGGNYQFVGKSLDQGGLWQVNPPTFFQEGNKWYLGYIQKEPNKDTDTYLTDREVSVYNQWARISNDSLRKRLGDLRYNDSEAGLWARYYSGKLGSDNYSQLYHTFQIGLDNVVVNPNCNTE